MTGFETLHAYLNEDFSDDYWSDDAILYAHTLLQHFVDLDWQHCTASWKKQTPQWQERLAQILHFGETAPASTLLSDMILQAEEAVALVACDSLRSMEGLQFSPTLQNRLLLRLDMLQQCKGDSIYRHALSSLHKQLST